MTDIMINPSAETITRIFLFGWDGVPPHVTVAGIPAQPVGQPTPEQPADCLDHAFTI